MRHDGADHLIDVELLFKLLSFLDKASLTRVRELNHFWKRCAPLAPPP